MTEQQHVDALFGQVAVFTRFAHLHALVERLKGRRRMSRTDERAHAAGLDGIWYDWPGRSKPLVDGVVPEAEEHVELAQSAREALDGDPKAKATLLDAYGCMLVRCKEMGLPPHATQIAEAYLARQLQRIARDEQRRGITDGPASHLVADIPGLARLARAYGIDTAERGAEGRWRHRLKRHSA